MGCSLARLALHILNTAPKQEEEQIVVTGKACTLSATRTTVLTEKVTQRLTPAQIGEAMKSLHEKLPYEDPSNPGLWVVKVDNHELWAILDSGAGQYGEDVITVIFPEDY